MSNFSFVSKMASGYINLDSITRIYTRKDEPDEEALASYEEEVGFPCVSDAEIYEIHIMFGADDVIYARVDISEFEHASKLMDISKEDILNLFIVVLVHYDFSISLGQFMWILFGDKTEIEMDKLNDDGIFDLLNESYSNIHGLNVRTAWMSEISGKYRTITGYKELTPSITPQHYFEEKQDEFKKYV